MLPLLLTLLGIASQESGPPAPRLRTRGTVKTVAGAPWSGARVVFVSAPIHEFPMAGTDVVRGRTDARGRFAVRLLGGRTYSAWATAEPVGRVYRCTTVADRVLPGTVVRLAETRLSHRQPLLRLTKRAIWADREPLSFHVLSDTANALALPVQPGADGEFLCPPLPGTRCTWSVRCKDGTEVMLDKLWLVDRKDAEAKPGAPVELAMPDRFPFLLRVITQTGKRPVAAARVYQRISYLDSRNHWMLAGTTGPAGFASLLVTRTHGVAVGARNHLYVKAQGTGCALKQFGRRIEFDKERDIVAMREKGRQDYTLQVFDDACTLSGRILIAKGVPAAHCKLALYPSFGSRKQRSFYLNVEPTLLVTDAEGRFRTDGWGPRFAYRLCVIADAALVKRLPAGAGYSTAPVVVAKVGLAEGDTRLEDVVLSELTPIDLAVQREDGFPASGAELAIVEAARSQEFRIGKKLLRGVHLNGYKPLRLVTGRRGKLRVLVPETRFLRLAVVHEGAWNFGSLFNKDGAHKDGAHKDGARRVIKLDAPALLKGRVVSGSGKPIAGAVVNANPTRYPTGFDTRLSTLITSRTVKTDGEGRFQLGVPFKECTYFLWARIQIDGTWFNSRVQTAAEVDENGVSGEDFELSLAVPEEKLPAFAERGDK